METPNSQDHYDSIGYYVTEEGYNYVDTFNKEWIDDHKEFLSGPKYCSNCYCYGTINQNGTIIFLGYCLNCALHLYEGKRGPGFQGFSSNSTELVDNYDYPEYLIKYKNVICSLNKKHCLAKNNSLSNRVDYKDYVNYLNYIDDNYDCDCDCDCVIELSDMDNDGYTDSDDESVML